MDEQNTAAETEHAANTNESFSELAALFRTTREAQKMTLETVAERMKIAPKHLHYFESDALDLEALDPFQRGYIRNYATVLELDITTYMTAFPDGKNVSTDLKSVDQRDQIAPALVSAKNFKYIILLLIVLLMIVLISINV